MLQQRVIVGNTEIRQVRALVVVDRPVQILALFPNRRRRRVRRCPYPRYRFLHDVRHREAAVLSVQMLRNLSRLLVAEF